MECQAVFKQADIFGNQSMLAGTIVLRDGDNDADVLVVLGCSTSYYL
jgi:hypothetical protein